MLFGGDRFANVDVDSSICNNINDPAPNCTVLDVYGMGTYNGVSFSLWLATFGRALDISVCSTVPCLKFLDLL
jgi:hypothetical protein